MNKALMGKWLWRYGRNRNSLWRKVIAAKYGERGLGWDPNETREPYGVSVWRGVSNGTRDFQRFIKFKPGRGDRVRFWEDKWCDGGPLRMCFPGLYIITTRKGATIRDMQDQEEVGAIWNFGWRRALYDWEEEDRLRLLQKIRSDTTLTEEKDKRVWILDEDEEFTVKSFYGGLEGQHEATFACKELWKARIPKKVLFFVWEACLGKLHTQDRLKQMGITLVNRCPICKGAEESIGHLLFRCAVSMQIWRHFTDLLNMSWIPTGSTEENFLSWSRQRGNNRKRIMGELTFFATLWGIWKQRNSRTFEGKEDGIEEVILAIKTNIYFWAARFKELEGISFKDFIMNWDAILG